MTANVIVNGLPADAVFPKLMYAFKGMFKRIQIKKFWIRELSETYGVDEKQMTIELNSEADAQKACNFLNNYPFSHPTTKQEYVLSAHIDESPMEPVAYPENRRWGGDRRQRPTKRERAQVRQRSPSPGYRSEASKLDLEIELLRKQRQVIEEERRLLLERKKLDMIREYGPSASRDYMDYDEFEPPRKRRLPPAPTEVKKPRKRSPPPPRPNAQRPNAPRPNAQRPNAPRNTNVLPAFFQPCKKIIAEMKELIERDSTPDEKEILIKLVRAALRKNLAIALEGREYMPAAEIIKLYREQHPKTEDEAFVGKILANIRASYLPTELEVKLASIKKEPKATDDESQSVNKKEAAEKDEKSLEKASDTSKVGENEEKQEVSEAESQDKPNAGNKTDADSTDISVDVKNDTSQKTNGTLEIANKEDLSEAKGEVTVDEPNTAVEESAETKGGVTTDEPNTNVEDSPEANVGVTMEEPNTTVENLPEAKGGVTTDEPNTTAGESPEAKGGVTSDEPLKSEKKAE